MNNKILIMVLFAVIIIIVATACIILKQGESNLQQEMAELPTVEIEATIVSLSIDPNQEECEGKCPGYVYPKDEGIIRIDKIIQVRNPGNVIFEGYNEGEQIEVRFTYSARPAKIRYIPTSVTKSSPETGVFHNISSEPIPKVDGYFIYTIESTSIAQPYEVTLPGLQIGNRIHAIITYGGPSKGIIGIYEILSIERK